MNRNIFRGVSITGLTIFYLYLCGGLYLGAYWMFLRVDPTPLISIVDIPKSFLKPFINSIGIVCGAVFIFFYTYKVFAYDSVLIKFSRWVVRNEFKIHRGVNMGVYFLVPILSALMFYFFPRNSFMVLVSGTALILLLSFRLFLSQKIKNFISENGINNVFFGIIVFTPIVSFITGLWESSRVHRNASITIVKSVIQANNVNTLKDHSSQSMKLLGFLGDKLIISSLDNKRIIYINQDIIERVELGEYSNEGE